jgi:hypothetical protein
MSNGATLPRLLIDDADTSGPRTSFFAFGDSGWTASQAGNSGYLFGTATKLNKNATGSFNVMFSGELYSASNWTPITENAYTVFFV